MSVENGAKAIIAAMSPVETTHNPSDQIRRLLKNGNLDASLVAVIEEALPLFDKLGFDRGPQKVSKNFLGRKPHLL